MPQIKKKKSKQAMLEVSPLRIIQVEFIQLQQILFHFPETAHGHLYICHLCHYLPLR